MSDAAGRESKLYIAGIWRGEEEGETCLAITATHQPHGDIGRQVLLDIAPLSRRENARARMDHLRRSLGFKALDNIYPGRIFHAIQFDDVLADARLHCVVNGADFNKGVNVPATTVLIADQQCPELMCRINTHFADQERETQKGMYGIWELPLVYGAAA